MATDINLILKRFLTAVGKNEAAAIELSKELRSWVQDNGEMVKEKIENRIEDTASRMGFVKESDLANLLSRISQLESRLPETKTSVKKTIKKSAKKTIKKSAKKTIKKSANSASKRTSQDRSKG